MLDRAYRQRELAHKSPATRRMYDLFLSRLAAVNNNLEKYMPSGIEVDGISFNELALVNRPEHAAVLGRIFTSWSLIESSITALLGLLFIVRRGYGIPPNPRSHTPNLTPRFRGCPGLTRDFRKQKTRVSARLDAGFGTSGYYLKLVFGAAAGIKQIRKSLVTRGSGETWLLTCPQKCPQFSARLRFDYQSEFGTPKMSRHGAHDNNRLLGRHCSRTVRWRVPTYLLPSTPLPAPFAPSIYRTFSWTVQNQIQQTGRPCP